MGYRIIGQVPHSASKSMQIIYLDNGKEDLTAIDVSSLSPGSEARDINSRDMWILTNIKTWQQCPWREGIIEEPVVADVPEGQNLQFVRIRDAVGNAAWSPLSSVMVENPTTKGSYVREAYYATPEDETKGILSFKWSPAADIPPVTEAGHFYIRACKPDGTVGWADFGKEILVKNLTLADWKKAQAAGNEPEWSQIIDSIYDAFQGSII